MSRQSDTTQPRPLVGISTCLLGEKVRYDGGSKLDRYLHDTLGRFVKFVPVCPEVESGMGVPRDAMRLVNMNDQVRLVTGKTGTDQTVTMQGWMKKRLPALSGNKLCGYIFKSRSPSCGLFRVKVYSPEGMPTGSSRGIYAGAFTIAFPLVPVEEEGRLNDGRLRENFIERIFIMQRWYTLNESRRTAGHLMEYHARHKYILMAHCPATLKTLGKYLANSRGVPIREVYDEYFKRFIHALAKIATPSKNTNVLQHIMGYFKKTLSSAEKAELVAIIENYHKGLVPLIVPVTMLNHYVNKYNDPYLAKQYYLNPHPLELMLRNHV